MVPEKLQLWGDPPGRCAPSRTAAGMVLAVFVQKMLLLVSFEVLYGELLVYFVYLVCLLLAVLVVFVEKMLLVFFGVLLGEVLVFLVWLFVYVFLEAVWSWCSTSGICALTSRLSHKFDGLDFYMIRSHLAS